MHPGQATRSVLDDLRWHWGDAYEITEAIGVWRAVRLDNQVSLIASDGVDLRDLIVDDYSRHPVDRP